MLVELAVRNLGVIADARVAFGPGMTALTGETGAGKTMVVEAIGLLLGGRPDPARVRPGADEAVVEGRLVVVGADGDEEEVVLRRVVPRSGRSRSYVNGEMAPSAQLAEIGAASVELHGQHSQQWLMRPASQRSALDRFGAIDLGPWHDAHATVTAIEAELAGLGGDARTRAREIDLLRFQSEELGAARIERADEDDALSVTEDLLADAVAHREAGANAAEALSGDDGMTDRLARVIASLDHRSPFDATVERLRAAEVELADAARELRDAVELVEEDPERLASVRARRQQLVELRRKYGDTLAEVMEEHAAVDRRLEELLSHDSTVERLTADLEAARSRRALAAAALGSARRAAAPDLAEAIAARAREVAMEGARVEVDVDGDAGEQVTIRFAANVGLEPGPLAKVASGGELSRTMLAMHLVLSEGPPTLVFDEVDAGIGGTTANRVGRALAHLAEERQVIVVTHLPQVAAYADRQLSVSKDDDGHMTTTSITALDQDGRVVELSRMLSGTPDSEVAHAHAGELLAAAAEERGR
jgi:DNA repair protein RecN (Recombination protein N)